MFEGQNIHISPVDGKRLCSFSQKICKQHRLNNYAFCIRHILEDKNAPFKQCQFKIKSNGENCFNPVPSAEDRVYCNSHLQVLGLIPKNASKHMNSKKKMSAAALKKGSKKKGSTVTKKKKVPAAAAAAAGKGGSNESVKIRKKARKILQLEEEEEKGQRSWYATMRKAFKRTAYNLHSWQKQGMESEVCDFLKQRKYQRQNEQVFGTRKVDSSDSEEEEYGNVGEPGVCQSMLLNPTERVHHNVLHQETSGTQEQKFVARLKHQQGQLKHEIASRQNQSSLSYSVLSKLVSSARKSALETTNVLNMQSGLTSVGSFKLYRERLEAVTYRVPCALLTGDVRCTKPTLPFSRYCSEHVSIDTDQYLFSSEPCAAGGIRTGRPQTLDFLRIIDASTASSSTSTSASLSKRKGNVSPVPSKRSQQKSKSRVVDKKKNKTNPSPVSKVRKAAVKRPRDSFRNEMQKKFSIPAQSHQKMNAHLRKAEEEIEEDDRVDVEEDVDKGLGLPEQTVSKYNAAQNSGESEDEGGDNDDNEDDEDDEDDEEAEDILTPEEAFHLPPGSLSFSPRMVDDDAMPTIKNRTLEEDDEELLRCASNFPFDSATQLPRDITSPTLNQLSSTDFTNFSNIFMSPAKTVEHQSDTCQDTSPPKKQLFSPSSVSRSPNLSTVCRPNSTTNNVNNRHSSSETTSLHRDHNGTTGLGREQKAGPNLLKISHVVDAYNNKQTAKAHMTSSLYNNNMRKQLSNTPTNNTQRSNNTFNSLTSNDNVQENKNVAQYRNNQMTPMGNALPNVVTNDSMNTLSKRYLSDSLLMQQPLAQDSTLFDDINTDVESPLEKVNPDIFFSSVFPVSTSTEGI